MSEQLTASAVISFCAEWEDQAVRFYEQLAARFPDQAATFKAMAGDSAKHKVLVQRTYQETVSDILETGYAFGGFKPQDFLANLDLSGAVTLAQGVAQAIKLEENAVAFYAEAAKRSMSLLATVTRAFSKVSAKRAERLAALRNI